MFVNFNILNQLGSPAINSNTFANRPAAGQTGRLFVSTDTFEIYRDNGTTWDLIGGPGSSTITGTGTATQVAYFTSSQVIGSSANLFWDDANGRLGIGTNTPGVRLDIHGTANMLHLNSTSATANAYMSFQRTGTNVWRIGDTYNSGANFFGLFNSNISTNAIAVLAATNKTEFTAVETYSTGLARGNYFDYNLNVPAGGSFSSPNAITALTATLDLTLAGNATIPSGARSGLDAYNSIAFTGAGTLTHNQGAQIRAYSNLTAGWAFNGTAIGTITHLAGLRALFPDNSGSAVNVTNNYALLLNDQTPNTGTVTYTNRWGVYQEGASDLNYMAANLLLGSTTNSGERLQVTGTGKVTDTFSTTKARSNSAGTVALKIAPSDTVVSYGFRIDQANNNLNIDDSYNNVNLLQLTTSGNLGLGISNPSAKLQIKQSTSNWYDGIRVFDGNSNTWIGLGNTGSLAVLSSSWDNTGSFLPLAFYTSDLERMRITSGGNVLIGTTTDAGYNLQVNGTANATTLYENGVRVIPSQTGNSGKYLTTDGTTTSWATVSAGKQTAIFRVTTNGSGSVTATQIQGISGVTWAATISGSNIVLTPTPNILTFNSIATGSTAISSGGTILICVPQALGSSSQTFSFYNTSNVQVDMSTTATASQRPTILQIIIN